LQIIPKYNHFPEKNFQKNKQEKTINKIKSVLFLYQQEEVFGQHFVALVVNKTIFVSVFVGNGLGNKTKIEAGGH